MPCDTISTVEVDATKFNADLLFGALLALGLQPKRSGTVIYFGQSESFNSSTGKLIVAALRDVGEIKRAYGAEIVKSQAKRFGWQLKEVGTFKYEVIKR